MQLYLIAATFILLNYGGHVANAGFRTFNLTLDCRQDWVDHAKCLKSKENDYRRTSPMTQQEREELRSKIRQCYKNENCADPFLSDKEQQIRLRCYGKFRDRMRSDLQSSVQREFSDYELPAEDDSLSSTGQDMMRMLQYPCKARNEQNFQRCKNSARGKKGFNQQQRRTEYCEVRYQCYGQSRVRQECYDRSAKVLESLCSGSKSLPVATYRQLYQQCLQENNAAFTDENHDYNLLVLSNLNSGAKYCSNLTDPCGGFSGRRNLGRKRQGGNGGKRGSWSRFGSGGSGGGKPQGGDRSSSQGGGGTSVSSSTNTTVESETGDLGTSSSSGIDFGSISSGSGIMPDPSSLISGSSLTGGGIGGLSSINPASVMGNGFDLTSLASGGGGLLGGGAPFDLSSIIPGGGGLTGGLAGGSNPFDLSSLFSGFGGKKK